MKPAWQGHELFFCPWGGVRAVRVVETREEVRRLYFEGFGLQRQHVRMSNRYASRYTLGMLTSPVSKAALVVEVDPSVADVPELRSVRAFVAGQSQEGERSSTWVVATRRPQQLRAALAGIHQPGVGAVEEG